MTRLLNLLLAFICITVSFGATYYIDYAAGNDSNSGTSRSVPWRLCPGMSGFSGSYSHTAGDRFIFKGGVSWPQKTISVQYSGTVGVNDYYGVDKTWYAGSTWTQPILDSENTTISAINANFNSNLVFDGFKCDNAVAGGSDWGLVWINNNYNIYMSNLWLNVTGAISDDNTCDIVKGYVDGDPNVGNPWCDTQYLVNSLIVGPGHYVAGSNPLSACQGWRPQATISCTICNVVTGLLTFENSKTIGCDIGYICYSISGSHGNCIEDECNHAHTSIVANNVLHDCVEGSMIVNFDMAAGMYGWTGNHGYVFNNVFYNCDYVGSAIVVQAVPGEQDFDLHVWNNTADLACPAWVFIAPWPDKGLILDEQNNFVISDPTNVAPAGDVVITHAQALSTGLTSASSIITIPWDGNQYYQDTPFNSVNPYMPNGNSVAGVNLSSLATTYNMPLLNFDRLGNARPAVGSWDIGAYEWSENTNPIASVSVSSIALPAQSSVVTNNIGLTNIGGGTLIGFATLTGDAFAIIGTTNFSLASNTGTLFPVRYTPATTSDSGSVAFSGGSNGTVTVTLSGGLPIPITLQSGLTWASTNTVVTGLTTTSSNCIYWAPSTVTTPSGEAKYYFIVPTNGTYTVSALVNDQNSGSANSLYVNVNGANSEAYTVWDTIPTNGWTSQTVTWRGANTLGMLLEYNPQFNPATWALTTGVTNYLLIQGREQNTYLGQITVSLYSPATNTPVAPGMIVTGTLTVTGSLTQIVP